ncbi:MAG: hypothetical protein ISN28_09040 [Ectothiorhodospiraceae bacterium AqS1]|nr:hypothetical protein [Ectothiorhodospiraceae bacterium AqS1]
MRPWDTIRLCGMMGAALSEFSKGLISDLSDHRGQRTTGSYLLGTSETILNHGRSVMHSIESMERIFHLENDLHRLAGGVSVEEVMEDKTKEADPVH